MLNDTSSLNRKKRMCQCVNTKNTWAVGETSHERCCQSYYDCHTISNLLYLKVLRLLSVKLVTQAVYR